MTQKVPAGILLEKRRNHMGLNGNRGNDPMWNVARTAHLEAHHLEQEAEDRKSPEKRMVAYIVMVAMALFIVTMVTLFFVL